MTTGEIRAGQISASSNYPPEWDRGCSEKYARVYQPGDQAWCAKYKSASEWLQVDLGVPAKVTSSRFIGLFGLNEKHILICDQNMFSKVLNNTDHVLHHLLTPVHNTSHHS